LTNIAISSCNSGSSFKMATMNISLPIPMKEWVIAQEAAGKYSTASDYVRELIRRDPEYAAQTARLQALVTEGIESGISDLTAEEVLARADEEYKRQNALLAYRGCGP
jgi:antitoxin ParD1/3/4